MFDSAAAGTAADSSRDPALEAQAAALVERQAAFMAAHVGARLAEAGIRGATVDARHIAGLGLVIAYHATSGDGTALTAGSTLDVDLPLIALPRLAIVGWAAIVNAGTATFDVQRAAYATSPVFSSLCGGNQPAIATGTANRGTVLDGQLNSWSFTTGESPLLPTDLLRFRATALSGVARFSFCLGLERVR